MDEGQAKGAGPEVSRAGAWWLAMRPRTLSASVVPIVVGLGLAPPVDAATAAIAAATVASALAIQVAVNFANDVHDAEAGIDTDARLGPVRAVQAGLLSAADMRRGFAAALALAVLFGLPLVLRGGSPILAVGLVSMACAWAYSGGPRPLASLGLGDLFVFVFFGVVPVCGTVWLQRLSLGPDAVLASIPVALLAVAILVVNNLRDIDTDRAAGKRTLAVRLGERATRAQYVACVVVAMLLPVLVAVTRGPLALLAVLVVARPARRAVANLQARGGAALNASLAETARLQVLVSLALAAAYLAAQVLPQAVS